MIAWLDSLSDEMYWCAIIALAITAPVLMGIIFILVNPIVEETTLWLRRLYRHWWLN